MNTQTSSFRYGTQGISGRRGNFTGAMVAIVLHVVAVVALLQYEPVRSALSNVAPIMVSMIITPAAEKPDVPPKPLPIKPQVQPKPVVPQQVITAPVEAPTSYVAPPTSPAPVVETPVVPAAPAPAIAAAPAPIVPPSFNAKYLQNPPPAYPNMARRMGQQGKVVLRVFVSATGLADQVELRSGSGYNALDQAALETVKRWRFVPARQGDQPVAAWVLVPITFTLEG